VGNRSAKQEIRALLKTEDPDQVLGGVQRFPVHRAVRYLLLLLSDSDEGIKRQAVTFLGVLVAGLAGKNMEAARGLMRRLMWSLNDESGSIGWGAPEAMAEIMLNHEGLANEYGHMLISYLREDGNYLDNVLLQQGVLRGLIRLARVRPGLLVAKGVLPCLRELARSKDDQVRSLAAQCLEILAAGRAIADSETSYDVTAGDGLLSSIHPF